MEPKKLLTAAELASFLNVSKTWVYIKTRDKSSESIPRIMCGKHLRFELGTVMAWLRNQNKTNIQQLALNNNNK